MIKIILVVTNIMKTLFIIFTTTIAIFLPHTLSSQNRASLARTCSTWNI